MMHSQDIELVHRVVAKDRAAFEQFFDAYFGRLFRFCSVRVSDAAACEDIVQETMIKAMRHLDGYRGEASLFTWLCQICRNEMSNWFARHGRKDAPLLSLDDEPGLREILESLASTETDEVDRFATVRLVQLALDYLPDRYGKALEWKYVEGLSVLEIAKRLDTGEIAVQSLLARARKAFRGAIEELQQEFTQVSGKPRGTSI